MTTTFFQPPALWPFTEGTAVCLVRYESLLAPAIRIPAVVLHVGGTKASIQRADKKRATSARLRSLALRGYCNLCPAPAIVGSDGQLRCPKCGAPAVDQPPPDGLVLRWFPLDEYHTAIKARRSFEHPTWSYKAAAGAAADMTHAASRAMLERLGLQRLYAGENPQTVREEVRLLRLMDLYAALGDDRAFVATYQELRRLQGQPRSACERARPLRIDHEDSYLLHLMGRSEETHAPAVVRPTGDDEPDDDHGTVIDRWLDAQFRRAA